MAELWWTQPRVLDVLLVESRRRTEAGGRVPLDPEESEEDRRMCKSRVA
jgi:hypothetical protein